MKCSNWQNDLLCMRDGSYETISPTDEMSFVVVVPLLQANILVVHSLSFTADVCNG